MGKPPSLTNTPSMLTHWMDFNLRLFDWLTFVYIYLVTLSSNRTLEYLLRLLYAKHDVTVIARWLTFELHGADLLRRELLWVCSYIQSLVWTLDCCWQSDMVDKVWRKSWQFIEHRRSLHVKQQSSPNVERKSEWVPSPVWLYAGLKGWVALVSFVDALLGSYCRVITSLSISWLCWIYS